MLIAVLMTLTRFLEPINFKRGQFLTADKETNCMIILTRQHRAGQKMSPMLTSTVNT